MKKIEVMKKKILVIIIGATILIISTISILSARGYSLPGLETGSVPNDCTTTPNTECYEGSDRWACHPFGNAGNCEKN